MKSQVSGKKTAIQNQPNKMIATQFKRYT